MPSARIVYSTMVNQLMQQIGFHLLWLLCTSPAKCLLCRFEVTHTRAQSFWLCSRRGRCDITKKYIYLETRLQRDSSKFAALNKEYLEFDQVLADGENERLLLLRDPNFVHQCRENLKWMKPLLAEQTGFVFKSHEESRLKILIIEYDEKLFHLCLN